MVAQQTGQQNKNKVPFRIRLREHSTGAVRVLRQVIFAVEDKLIIGGQNVHSLWP
jgi:hypothetical protein